MKKTNKKGFTIVELVIVIAVIAILAAVLIPNISRLVKKANQSADIQLVRNMNTALQIDGAGTKTYNTMHEALEAVKEAGYDVETIAKTAADNVILWDSVNQCDALLVDGKGEPVYYPETDKEKAEDYQLWKVYDKESDLKDAKYSIYWNGEALTSEVEIKGVGFDAGNKTVASVKYTGASDARKVTIRTNSNNTLLTIDAEKDSVSHFDDVGTVNVVRVAMASYHENGTVAGNINVAQGNVVVAATAKVSNVVVMPLGEVTPTSEKVSVKVADAAKSGTKVQDTANVLTKVEGVTKETATVVRTAAELTAAIANGGNIILGADITSSITVAKDVTLNLGQYTLTGSITVSGGTLTLDGNGTVKNSGTGKLILIYGAGKVVVNSGSYTSGDVAFSVGGSTGGGELVFNSGSVVAQEACVNAYHNGIIEINGGTFTSKDNFVIGTNGSTGNGNNKITINDGVFNGNITTSGYIACGIYLANLDTLTVNGGVFNITNGCGILVRSGTATIENVKINLTADGKVSSGKVGDSKVTVDAAATIVLDYQSTYPGGKPNLVKNNSGYTVQELNK